MLAITSLYGGLLALLFVAVSARVIRFRQSNRVAVGDDGNSDLQYRIRVQANAAEYIPLGLILLALTELQGAPAIATHVLGLTLLIGRCLHAYSMSKQPQILKLRTLGMALTLFMITISAFGLVIHSLL